MGIDEVGLYGHSMGANTAAKASEMMSNLKFMILEDPAGLLYKELDSENDIKRRENCLKITDCQHIVKYLIHTMINLNIVICWQLLENN